jgi:hypothetical protein
MANSEPQPAASLGRTLKGYFWWTHPRGSVPYDVMVSLILAFIFLAPIWINFRDKPQPRPPHQSEVVAWREGNALVYTVDAAAVQTGNDAEIRDSLLRVIRPVAGEIIIDRYLRQQDRQHNIMAYKVWAHR